MTFNQLAIKIAKLEGKKSQTSIANIREILSILVKLHEEHLNGETPFSPIVELTAIAYDRQDKPKRSKKK
jgi:hypothetical protein